MGEVSPGHDLVPCSQSAVRMRTLSMPECRRPAICKNGGQSVWSQRYGALHFVGKNREQPGRRATHVCRKNGQCPVRPAFREKMDADGAIRAYGDVLPTRRASPASAAHPRSTRSHWSNWTAKRHSRPGKSSVPSMLSSFPALALPEPQMVSSSADRPPGARENSVTTVLPLDVTSSEYAP